MRDGLHAQPRRIFDGARLEQFLRLALEEIGQAARRMFGAAADQNARRPRARPAPGPRTALWRMRMGQAQERHHAPGASATCSRHCAALARDPVGLAARKGQRRGQAAARRAR